jgi:aryl-alcohol dehydrogenase-like predicted oxidoreductase
MLASLDESLSALGTDYVDVWQIHNADAALLAEADTLRAVFTDVRAAGKARWFGASTYGRTDPLLALQTGLFDILQVAYSVIDQRLADEVFAAAVAAGAGLLIRSVLLKGVLTDRAEHLPDRLSRLRDASRAFRGVAEQITPAVTPAQAAIAFALAHPQLSAILIGVRTIAELNENLAALNVSLPPETLNRLRHLRVDDDDLVNPATWNMP